MLLLLLCVLSPQDGDAAIRAKVKDLVARLDADALVEREKAAAELQEIPVRFAPYMAAIDKANFSASQLEVLDLLVVPAPWPAFLRGSIKQARQVIDAIGKAPSPNRWNLVNSALFDLSKLQEPEIRKVIGLLLASDIAGIKDFGLRACACWPVEDLRPIREALKTPELAMAAAHALVVAGDRDAIPEAVDLYVQERKTGYSYMNQLLCVTGVEDRDIDRVIASWKHGHEPSGWDFGIVASRRSQKAVEALSAYIESNERNAWAVDVILASLMGDAAIPVIRAGRAKRTAEIAKLHTFDPVVWDPEVALRWLDRLGADPSPGDLVWGRFQGWLGGRLLRDKLLARIKDPATKASLRAELIWVLGTAGVPEDAALVVEHLNDPRFAPFAAEALSKIGGPEHGKAMLTAFMKTPYGGSFGRSLLAFEFDDLEATLIEIMSDPKAYMMQATFALGLAGRQLTPKLRDFVVESYPKWQGYQSLAAEKMLLDRQRLKDRALINQLLANGDPVLRGIGHHLNFRTGNRDSRAPAVAATHEAFGRQPEREREFWLDAGLDAGEKWIDAVAKYVKDQPTWSAGVNWLARQDHRETRIALDKAAGKDPQIESWLSKAWEGRATPQEASMLVAAARGGNALVKRSILAIARHEALRGQGPGTRMAAELALPEGLPLYRMAVSRCSFRMGGTGHDGINWCIRALVEMKDLDSLPNLRSLVRSEDPSIRAAAMEALVAFHDKDGVAWIARFLDDDTPVPTERRTEMWTLDWIPPERMWHRAMSALETITGEKPPAGADFQRREFWRKKFTPSR